jgi:hypothetical protein
VTVVSHSDRFDGARRARAWKLLDNERTDYRCRGSFARAKKNVAAEIRGPGYAQVAADRPVRGLTVLVSVSTELDADAHNCRHFSRSAAHRRQRVLVFARATDALP